MWYNPFITWLLRSPFHGFMSKSTMLITFTGRKSGKTYTTPVNYWATTEGEKPVYITTSHRARTWWRNFRQGAPLTARIRGKAYRGIATVVEDEAQVSEILRDYFHHAPQMARYFGVRLQENGEPDPADIQSAARTRVIVKTSLI